LVRRLIALVTGGATLSLAGCVSRVVGPADGDAGGDHGSSDDETSSTGGGSSGNASVGASSLNTGDSDGDHGDGDHGDGDGDDGDPPPRFDIPFNPDVGVDFPPGDCVDFRPDTPFLCPDAPELPGYQCGALPESGTCDDVDLYALMDAINDCFGSSCDGRPHAWDVVCGPDPGVADMCCYWFEIDELWCPGRPFLVGGSERVASLVPRSDWASVAPGIPAPAGRTRAAMAAAFAEAATFEHASVASFARFTLELLAVGAPSLLVDAAVQAGREEIEHARLWYGLAAQHGHPVGPGPLAIDGALPTPVELGDVVARAVQEGCIAETISAWQARVAARSVTDLQLRARMQQLADEELRHCELAWAFVRWALERAPQLRPRVAATFARATEHVPRGPTLPEDLAAAVVRGHGLLPRRDRLRLAADALIRLVHPTARALLDSLETSAAGAGRATMSR
jgi:hypothetical protein